MEAIPPYPRPLPWAGKALVSLRRPRLQKRTFQATLVPRGVGGAGAGGAELGAFVRTSAQLKILECLAWELVGVSGYQVDSLLASGYQADSAVLAQFIRISLQCCSNLCPVSRDLVQLRSSQIQVFSLPPKAPCVNLHWTPNKSP